VRALPLDLHVLGTPPAFILSQDQTLQKKFVLTSVETDCQLPKKLDLFKTIHVPEGTSELTLMSAQVEALGEL
jgi:hypothetical protein